MTPLERPVKRLYGNREICVVCVASGGEVLIPPVGPLLAPALSFCLGGEGVGAASLFPQRSEDQAQPRRMGAMRISQEAATGNRRAAARVFPQFSAGGYCPRK